MAELSVWLATFIAGRSRSRMDTSTFCESTSGETATMGATAADELQKLLDAGVRFSVALEDNGWFSVRVGNYLTRPFATNYSPTFELAVAAVMRASFDWPMAS
jgi:hypothetical protein